MVQAIARACPRLSSLTLKWWTHDQAENRVVEGLAAQGVSLCALSMANCCSTRGITEHAGLQELQAKQSLPASLERLTSLHELRVLRIGRCHYCGVTDGIKGAVLQQIVGSCRKLHVLDMPLVFGEPVNLTPLHFLTDLTVMLPLPSLPHLLESSLPCLQSLCLSLLVGSAPLPHSFHERLGALVGGGRADALCRHSTGTGLLCFQHGYLTASVLSAVSLLQKFTLFDELELANMAMVTGEDIASLANAVGDQIKKLRFFGTCTVEEGVLLAAAACMPTIGDLFVLMARDLSSDQFLGAARYAACSPARKGRPLKLCAQTYSFDAVRELKERWAGLQHELGDAVVCKVVFST